jgi:hypothetical protein
MYLPKACIIGCLLAMSLVNSSHALAQTLSPLDSDKPRIREKKPIPKVDFKFMASELFLAGGTAFDMKTTVTGLSHPTTAYRADGIFLTHYYPVETGWARCFGNRNTFAIVNANVGLNAGINVFARRLATRGGRWRFVALGLDLAKATFSSEAAIHNIRYNATVDNRVRLETGYKGLILWSR